MMEVAVQNGSGQVAKLGKLADKINEQHRACGLAVNAALDHALEAGRLLVEVKAGCKHGTWRAWLEENFAGSARTARSYMYLYRNRERIMAKRQSDAILSVADAARSLRVLDPPPEPKYWQREWTVDAHPDPDVKRQWEEDQKAIAEQKRRDEANRAVVHAANKAEEQAKKGDPTKPRSVKVPDEVWREEYERAEARRIWEAGKMIFELLRRLQAETDPNRQGFCAEEVGKGMAHIKPPDAALRQLRSTIGWLEQVLEMAEQEQGQQPDKPQGDENAVSRYARTLLGNTPARCHRGTDGG